MRGNQASPEGVATASVEASTTEGHRSKSKDWYRIYALVVMTLVYACNLLDRYLMGLLLQPIKLDLKLTDTELGILTGIAFGLFYAVLGLPIASLADRGNRVRIASAAIGVWGVTVMSCLAVVSFPQLLAARVLAGVGEAGCKPPLLSLLADYFPIAKERIRAMAFWWLGAPLATFISYIAGGWLNDRFGWRMTFFIAGIPGIVLALLVLFTLAEPRKFLLQTRAWALGEDAKAAFNVLWQTRSCRHLTIALILLFTFGIGLTSWNAVFMIREHGMTTTTLGLWMGLIIGTGSLIGIAGGGFVASTLLPNSERAHLTLSAVATIVAVPLYLVFLWTSDAHLALLILLPWMVLINIFAGPVYSMLQQLVPDNLRATSMAIVMMLYNLIGMGLGPLVVGVLSDRLAPVAGTGSLRISMALVSLIGLWSGYHFWLARKTIGNDLLHRAKSNDGTLCLSEV